MIAEASSQPMHSDDTDTIVARATAPGAAALAILRLDGPAALAIARRLFTPRSSAHPADRPRLMMLGAWRDPATAGLIDEGLTVCFQGPASFTGNDVAEFHAHGGRVPSERLLQAALACGARLAEPGEFTRRAFLNGKLDLAQAEAVADLIAAQTEAAARLAGRQLEGALSQRIGALREGLLMLAAEIEARIDFPEEDLPAADRARLMQAFTTARTQLAQLLATARRGQLLREGARVALIGRPNAGKSSLLNALARMERAIVTPHPGTTRDTIECTIDLAGVPLTLVDTAGLRASDDPIEQLGIERTRREMESADLVVLVADASDAAAAHQITTTPRAPDLIVWNKCDLLAAGSPPEMPNAAPQVAISALTGAGLADLERALTTALQAGSDQAADTLAINLRHRGLLERCAAACDRGEAAFAAGESGEFLMIELREALDPLGEILGLATGDAILDRIFSGFCIGK